MWYFNWAPIDCGPQGPDSVGVYYNITPALRQREVCGRGAGVVGGLVW